MPSVVIGPGETIKLPKGQVDYEIEFAVIVGKSISNASPEEALQAVFGYTILNDISARDIQFKDNQITLSKNFDTFCPIKSKRLSFIGTDWFDLGVRQGEAMVRALNGKKGKVALLGLIEQTIDQQAFAGFKSIGDKSGLTVLDPQEDKGNQAEVARVAAAIIQANPDLVGMAGFDSESGPGIGQAIKEAGKAGQIVATCADAEPQHLRLVKEGILTAAIGQKRELFTYQGVKALYDVRHSKLQFTKDDKAAGVVGIPINYITGTYTVTKENVQLFMKG